MTAVRIQEAPILDGQVIQDQVWLDIPPATDFWQTQPDEGEPASEKTEVRIAYTDDAFYVSAVCYDSDPGQSHRFG